MVSELAQALSGQSLGNELYVGVNVQEEAGLRGATPQQLNLSPNYFCCRLPSSWWCIWWSRRYWWRNTDSFLRLVISCCLIWKTSCLLRLTAGIKYQYYCAKGGTWCSPSPNGGCVPFTTTGVCALYIQFHQTLLCNGWLLQAQAFLQAIRRS